MSVEQKVTNQDVSIAGTKKFKCGCQIDKLDFSNIPLDCPATWDLIGTGFTKGIFQLEGSLGKRYSKEIKPRNIGELSDLISLIRPGCLEAEYREDPKTGKMISITSSYIKVRNGDLEPEYIDPVLEPIFKKTYGVPVYQEQIMRICTDFAGFSLKEADNTRKAVGKKIPELMEKVKTNFIESAKKNGHPEELAETIFGWIDKFSGYGFNLSHGVSYAMIGYKTAYAKRHFPLEFFKAMLTNSDGKQDELDEIHELVHEARLFNIEVLPPCLKRLNSDFDIVDGNIVFGLGYIKGVGKSALKTLKKIAKIQDVDEMIIASFNKGSKINKGVMESIIKSGALDYLGGKRIDVLKNYRVLSFLTERERNWVFKWVTEGKSTLQIGFEELLNSKIPNKNRKPKIQNEINSIYETLNGNHKKMCIAYEKHYLGIPLSGSLVDLHYNPKVDIKCRNLHKLANKRYGCLGVVIHKIKTIKDKNHNQMCFLTVSDDTYHADVVVFCRQYSNYSWILEEGKPILITGRKDRESFIANSIEHL